MSRGLFNCFFKFLFNFVFKLWYIYFIGFFFGLGFDIVSEIAFLVFFSSVIKVSMVGMFFLFIFFVVGMSLFDILDGVFMFKVYDWVFKIFLRKIYYNIFIMVLSVFIAFFIGLIEFF